MKRQRKKKLGRQRFLKEQACEFAHILCHLIVLKLDFSSKEVNCTYITVFAETIFVANELLSNTVFNSLSPNVILSYVNQFQ